MTNWTKEQLDAINSSGKNIIVSAGAGSGKTAVLTQRVVKHLEDGMNINNLLILTFTNAAAKEMKDRIRKGISSNDKLKDQLSLIESAYITTFDSFALSVVKKYNYLLNVSKDINIIDTNVCNNLKKKILEDIFEELYLKRDENFIKLISDFTIKDDKELKNELLNINNKLDNIIDRDSYLNSYIDNYYSNDNLDSIVNDYVSYLLDLISEIKELLELIYNECEPEYYDKLYNSLKPLLESTDYDSIKSNCNIKIPELSRKTVNSDELKRLKGSIKPIVEKIIDLVSFENIDDIKKSLIITKPYAEVIVYIFKELDKRLNEYKSYNDVYSFTDIAKLAIKVVEENDEVRKELTNSFDEIMLDEYQDTNDIQEKFINLIENNNVYMVGDVKQSIYGFRNANPKIFKEKYDNYSNNIVGMKIDLLNNFRSREEVLTDINKIFDLIMNDNFGGADYKKSHRMLFGNLLYKNKHPEQSFNLELYNYNIEDKSFSDSEHEAFIIARDIKKKIENKYQVIESGELRDAKYKDFCILLDKGTSFDLYKKIFEYVGIPLVIYNDEKITTEKDILIIKNIIDLIIKIKNKEFDRKFKYDIYSISRSYLSNITDEEFARCYISNNYESLDIYTKCKEIADNLDRYSSYDVLCEIERVFNIYENTIKVGNIDDFNRRFTYLKNIAKDLENLSYSIYDFNEYLISMIEEKDNEIKLSAFNVSSDSVRLMNIHKSKGLEFPICYFAGYNSKFNTKETNARFGYDRKYGLIIPYINDGINTPITHYLYRNKFIYEGISERIRLMYVALTRAKEKMIIVANLSEEEVVLNERTKNKYNSFIDILNSIKDYTNLNIVNMSSLNLTKDYNKSKSVKSINKSNEIIDLHEINIENSIVSTSKVSKNVSKLITQDELNNMKYGTKVHRLLETYDFNKNDNDIVNDIKTKLNISNATIYKEYEFIDTIDNTEYHGIIDLMIEHEDYIDIVDYKLSNIEDEAYLKQLSIYSRVINKRTNKNVNIYLYSIKNKNLSKKELQN